MKKRVNVILLEDIVALGQAGEIVSVSEGFARNALFPEGKAALATTGARKQKEEAQTREAYENARKLKDVQQKAESLNGTELSMNARIKDGDEIFGKITTKEIANELNRQAKLNVRPKQIKLKNPLTKIGSQDIEIALSTEVIATIRVTVVALPDAHPSHEEE